MAASRFLPFLVFAAVVAAAVGSARAEESSVDLFKDLLLNGCIASYDTGVPVAVYAQGAGLAPANANLAAAFLRGRPGTAYTKATPTTVLIIADAGDTCTVATRVAPDLFTLSQSVEAGLSDLKTSFSFVREEQRPVIGGGMVTTREFEGTIGQRPFGVLLSVTPTGSPQATVTVYRKVR